MAVLGVIFGVVLIAALVSALIGFLAMLAWNFVVPSVFGGPEITFLQAWVLMFLINLLTGGVRASARSGE